MKGKIAQYLSYLAALAFAWTLVGAIIQTNLSIDKLVKVNGIIDTTIEVATYRPKSNRKDHELRIYLKDTTEYFRFMDIYKYDNFREQIHNGDSTAIYIRPKWLVPLGLGYRNDIFQMTINGQKIFELSQTMRNENGILILCLVFIPLFIFLGQYVKKKNQKAK
jgi:hypothetical protein